MIMANAAKCGAAKKLQDLCREQLQTLQERDSLFSAKKAAIDVFHDLHAIDVLSALLEGTDFVVKSYAMAAIKDIAEPGDRKVAALCVDYLRRENGALHTGGSEVKIQ